MNIASHLIHHPGQGRGERTWEKHTQTQSQNTSGCHTSVMRCSSIFGLSLFYLFPPIILLLPLPTTTTGMSGLLFLLFLPVLLSLVFLLSVARIDGMDGTWEERKGLKHKHIWTFVFQGLCVFFLLVCEELFKATTLLGSLSFSLLSLSFSIDHRTLGLLMRQ
ncbi:hypothetical protein VTJ04DRAFT_6607 [Mycothermus thermophilus]|uniref:uncharacterized protein n=1 Tax=Humicola insolens TaxID=85995 RepID=UPI003744A017